MSETAPVSLDPAIREAIGHNKPPVKLTISVPPEIREYLSIEYKDVVDRYSELLKSADTMPAEIKDDTISGQAGDLIKEIRKWNTRAEGARKDEGEPFQRGKSTVDAWFKNLMEELEKRKKIITGRQDDYLMKKAREEERRREEAAAVERKKAEDAAREAAEAAERTRAAEEAQAIADTAAREARENKDELEQARLNAEVALANARVKKANARRDRDEEAFNAADAEVKSCIQALDAAKTELRNARQAQRDALAAAERAAQQTRAQERQAATAQATADQSTKKAEKIERRLEQATPGDLARTRGEHGSVNTLARHWEAYIKDAKLVRQNIAMLEPFIDTDDLKVLVNKRMRAGNKDVPGVEYEQVEGSLAV